MKLLANYSANPTKILLTVLAALAFAACEPEVGSARWCEAMEAKSRGDWTANEAVDYARHCLLDNRD